ncbi:MAG: hypothetical protein FJ379_07385 [Verrucomicrobia bacterium]|nr:hypothetical protein [Verrucomicrobiota bacterium]
MSGPAVFLLLRESSWRQAPPGLERLRSLHVEQWLAVLLLLLQLYFIVRARMDHVRARVDRESSTPPTFPGSGTGTDSRGQSEACARDGSDNGLARDHIRGR